MPREQLRIAYLSGPVDGVDVLNAWKSHRNLAYFGASHLTNFFEVCEDLDAIGYVITTLGNQHSRYETHRFVVENRPPPPSTLRGMRYHIAHALWLMSLLPAIFRFRPHVCVITAEQNYWFLLAVLKLRGIKIVAALTCALWPKYTPIRKTLRFLLYLNGMFFRHCVDAIMAMSNDIAIQVRKLLGSKAMQIAVFLPVYPRNQFASFRSANFDDRPFRIFFAGRIESNKGIYDLVEIARLLDERAPHRFHVEICGDGSEFASLRQIIDALKMNDRITCHGFCDREKLSALMQTSHIVIVPTTTKFEEGFNMVCAEAILAGRPLVTSAVCPALEYVKTAAIEVPPEDIQAYCNAIFELSENREFYESKQKACAAAQAQFYDQGNSWGATLHEVLVTLYGSVDSKLTLSRRGEAPHVSP